MTSTEDTDFDPKAAKVLRSRVGEYLEGGAEGRGLRVGVVCGKFNGAITTRLLVGALDALDEAGVERADISLAWAPGAFEIPMLARSYASGPRPVDAVITLGAVIRGDTVTTRSWRASARAACRQSSCAPVCQSSSAC